MNIENILKSGLINTSELARRIWPDKSEKAAKVLMSAKLSDKSTRQFTESDLEAIEKVLKNILK